MNIGDKLYCIKNYINYEYDIYYKKGKLYTISDKIKRVIPTIESEYYTYTIPNIKSKTTNLIDTSINKYFISLKELRKQKINKLKSNMIK